MSSKRYTKAKSMVKLGKTYPLNEAVELLTKFPRAKFDETVEVHFRLGVDPRKADQNIRNSVVLPHGTGKKIKVLVFAEGDQEEKKKKAGADYVGVADLIDKIKGGWFDFDVAIATPKLMGQVGKIGRILGPRGLMPNPKVGTVTNDVEKAVNESKGGKVTYKIDKSSNLHMPAGKLSFESAKLKENILTCINAILKDRPASVKGIYIKSIAITSTMNPGIKLDVAEATLEAKK